MRKNRKFIRHIYNNGELYLSRYSLPFKVLGVSFHLHKFHQPDPGREFHDHPWTWAASLQLAGYYVEKVLHTESSYRKISTNVTNTGMFRKFKGATFHRIDLVSKNCWTLFMHGPVERVWGFWDSAKWKKVAWDKFLVDTGINTAEEVAEQKRLYGDE